MTDRADHHIGTVCNPQLTSDLFLKTDITVKIHSNFVIASQNAQI